MCIIIQLQTIDFIFVSFITQETDLRDCRKSLVKCQSSTEHSRDTYATTGMTTGTHMPSSFKVILSTM